MRDIKFRAWDLLNKSFIYPDKGYQGHFIIDLNGRFHNLQNGSGGDEYIIQQFTGLKDKNGKEIYEGDIIKQYDGKRCGVVEWISESDGWDFTGWKMKNATWGDGIEGTEIIGNIFENPDTQI